jgi:type IX secretion system PorP/SprF family membrane protein
MKKILLCLLWMGAYFGGYSTLKAQDIQFSQFYANQVYLSPAFTGSSVGPRLALNGRSQWVAIPGAYRTFACAFDMPVDIGPSRHGFGLSAAVDQQGDGNLTRTDILFNYSFRLLINDRHAIRFGLAAGIQQASIDFYKLRFPNQYDPAAGYNPLLPSNENGRDNRMHEEITAGVLYYNKYFWVGYNVNHLTTPQQRFISSANPDAKLPMKHAVFTGFNIPINEKETRSISPSILFRNQGPFYQLDLGCYVNFDPLVLGMYYRAIEPDAIIGLVGIQKGMFRFGYSYDYTLSSLTNTISGGSHEVSFVVEFDKLRKKPKKASVNMSCPKF